MSLLSVIHAMNFFCKMQVVTLETYICPYRLLGHGMRVDSSIGHLSNSFVTGQPAEVTHCLGIHWNNGAFSNWHYQYYCSDNTSRGVYDDELQAPGFDAWLCRGIIPRISHPCIALNNFICQFDFSKCWRRRRCYNCTCVAYFAHQFLKS